MPKLLAQGESIEELAQYEDLIPEGAAIRLICDISSPLSEEELDSLFTEVESQGVVITDIRETLGGSPKLIIDAEKQLAPLAIFGLALGSLLALPVVIFNWRLFSMDPMEMFRKMVLPIVLICLGGVIILALILRPAAPKMVEAAIKTAPVAAVGARKAIMKV